MTQQTDKTPPITLDTLLTGDRTVFQLCPGDETMPAQLTVAELKEIVVAINVSSERIIDLNQRLVKAEEDIEKLESRQAASAAFQE